MPRALNQEGLIVFLRLPVLGKVKSRLSTTIGNEAALQVYQQLTDITLETISKSSAKIYLFYEGGLPEHASRQKKFIYHHQAEGSLGTKMLNALIFVLQSHSKAVIIGSDCPDLTNEMILDSFHLLNDYDVVIGPASDGGYYLLGCKKVAPSLFEDIAWSTSSVLTQTLDRINQNKLSYTLLPVLTDIDTASDWTDFLKRKN